LVIEQGLSQREIAERLYIGCKTVGTRTEHMFMKLGVRNRVRSASLARRYHLADMPTHVNG
jgi:DNA-binding NarL/FixJ family response regulator